MLGKADLSHGNIAAKQDQRGQQAEQKNHGARIEKHGARAEQQEKPKAAPPVVPAAQVRGPPAAVDRQAGRHLGDPKMVNARLHDHFEGEFHPHRIEFERQHRVATKAA